MVSHAHLSTMDEESQSALNDIRRGVMALGYTKIFFTEFDLIAVTPYEYTNLRNFLMEYDFNRRRWSIISYHRLPHRLQALSAAVFGTKIIIHGLYRGKIYQTLLGDLKQRPVRFKIIATLETPTGPKLHRIISDDTRRNLFAVSTVYHESNQTIRITVHRFDPTHIWTVIYNDVFLCDVPHSGVRHDRPWLMEHMVVYNNVLYIFPFSQTEAKIDFSKLIALDLQKTGAPGTADLLPAGEEFPSTFVDNQRNAALTQCPLEPWMVYLVLGNENLRPFWSFWRLNLELMQWFIQSCDMPEGRPFSLMSAATTKYGSLYLLRSPTPVVSDGEHVLVQVPPAVQERDVFRVTIHSPRLDGVRVELALSYLRDVNPHWQRRQFLQTIRRWLWFGPPPLRPPQRDEPAPP